MFMKKSDGQKILVSTTFPIILRGSMRSTFTDKPTVRKLYNIHNEIVFEQSFINL